MPIGSGFWYTDWLVYLKFSNLIGLRNWKLVFLLIRPTTGGVAPTPASTS